MMTLKDDEHQRARNAISAHFGAGCRPQVEEEMRAHLATCADCCRIYDRHLLLASLDPAAAPAEARLGRRLGFPRRDARARLPFGVGMMLGVAVAGAMVLFAGRRPVTALADGGFSPRGLPPVSAAPASSDLRVVRFWSGGRVLDPAAINPGDELAFAYRNPSGKQHLMVFAVDEHGHVYWYHPEWSDAQKNPAAVPISAEPGLHELPAAVLQHLDGERLMIHALFSDRELTVRQVEGAFAAAAKDGKGRTPTFPDATDVVRPLLVVR
jgi:hypothetical protein